MKFVDIIAVTLACLGLGSSIYLTILNRRVYKKLPTPKTHIRIKRTAYIKKFKTSKRSQNDEKKEPFAVKT